MTTGAISDGSPVHPSDGQVDWAVTTEASRVRSAVTAPGPSWKTLRGSVGRTRKGASSSSSSAGSVSRATDAAATAALGSDPSASAYTWGSRASPNAEYTWYR